MIQARKAGEQSEPFYRVNPLTKRVEFKQVYAPYYFYTLRRHRVMLTFLEVRAYDYAEAIRLAERKFDQWGRQEFYRRWRNSGSPLEHQGRAVVK